MCRLTNAYDYGRIVPIFEACFSRSDCVPQDEDEDLLVSSKAVMTTATYRVTDQRVFLRLDCLYDLAVAGKLS